MKTTFAVLALTLTTSLLPFHAEATDVGTLNSHSTLMVQVDGKTVAILPANSTRTLDVTSDETTYSKTRGATFKGHVKFVATVSGRSSITITGDSLALVPQK